ncbi:glycosyltransferase family 2 protein [Maribacter sp. MJ134]|uniref:glycosyltransferase family 2 protein n=1 Tax=Maribacter sp. MJ134 TaxID=2496865 RepID=UPI000F830C54|nr:glycosyltransferase family 2 protein [Maribacter sp. MJ134]AZQ58486.1 glycosyltransferase family 2 protein [Maribacter sp. MJ134]
MISVLIPLYNKEHSIVKTIHSVLIQTYMDFELLIIDDGSTDNSLKVVENIKDGRIRIIAQENGGVSSARNTGIKNATYEWIAFLDADDIWHKDFLKYVTEVIHNEKEVNVITTDYETQAADGTLIKSYVSGKRDYEDFFEITNTIGFHILNMSSFCVRKSSLLESGIFSTTITHGEDMEVFEKLARKHKIFIIDKVLSYYIQDSENRASTTLPHPNKTRVYQFNSEEKLSLEEVKYQKNRILVYMHDYTVQGSFSYAIRLFRKHIGFVKISDILLYIFNRLKRKFTSGFKAFAFISMTL